MGGVYRVHIKAADLHVNTHARTHVWMECVNAISHAAFAAFPVLFLK